MGWWSWDRARRRVFRSTLKLPVARQEISRALDYRNHPRTVVGGRERLVGLAPQFLDHATSRIRERLEIVAALQRHGQPPLAALGRHPLDAPRERGEAPLGNPHPAERIAKVRVEARRYQDEFRPILPTSGASRS